MPQSIPSIPSKMTAVLQSAYGDVGVYKTGIVDVPTPGVGQILVRVEAASLHADIWHTMRGEPTMLRLMGGGFRKPNYAIPGTDLAGVVVALGDGVDDFCLGDRVFGQTVAWNLWSNGGTYAQYAVADAVRLEKIPDGVDFAEAAATATSGQIVLQNMALGPLVEGCRILVHGAAGCVGSLAVQIAKARGVVVTAVDLPAKLDSLRALGADFVVDGSTIDPTEGSARYDMVFDVLGIHSLGKWRRVLEPTGHYVLIGHDQYGSCRRTILGSVPKMLGLAVQAPFVSQKVLASPPKFSEPPLKMLARWLESGAIAPKIDSVLGLEQLPQAMRRLVSNDVQGRIVFAP
jgi:NADPH:quinone reductase-like Zn-dependent oxidoreductase